MAQKIAPRRLRLLRIDDDITPGQIADPPPQYLDQEAPEHLETVFVREGDVPVAGIRSWANAIQFWQKYDAAQRIDLIVSDVKFLDVTSPLNSLATGDSLLPLPTGISHFKAFAAIARANGAVLGIGLHTKDAGIWDTYFRSKEQNLRFMSLLAAHEIGELAAIMGYAEDLAAAGAEGCWAWLRQFTVDKPNFRQAVPRALSEYRRRLKTVLMPPGDWQELVKWCGRMETSAANPDNLATLLLTEKEDPGFPILTADGSRDIVSLRSLFADVPLGIQGFSFDIDGLPRRCFSLEQNELFFELDEGYPRIGALVAACGDLTHAYQDALKILQRFPVWAKGAVKGKLTETKAQLDVSPLAVALAILLQEIRCEHALFVEWTRFYATYEWDHENDKFLDNEAQDSRTLQGWLSKASNLLKAGPVRSLDVVDMFHEAGACGDPDNFKHDGAVRCLKLLESLGVAEFDSRSNAYRKGDHDFAIQSVPEFPNPPPEDFFKHCELGLAFSLDRKKKMDPSRTLRILFGHDVAGKKASGDAVLERQLGQALGLGEEAATSFLKAFRKGDSPRWLKEVCREFAREVLQWKNSASWPRSLREKS